MTNLIEETYMTTDAISDTKKRGSFLQMVDIVKNDPDFDSWYFDYLSLCGDVDKDAIMSKMSYAEFYAERNTEEWNGDVSYTEI